MGALQMTGVALLASMLLLLLRELRPAAAPPLRLAASIFFVSGALSLLSPALLRLGELLSLAGGDAYTELLLTATGIALACELGAGFCRDLGESGVAEGLLFFGRAEILLLALPLVDQLVDLAREMLSW